MKQTPPSIIIIAISMVVIITCIEIDRSIKRGRREFERRQRYIQRHNQFMKELNELSRSLDTKIRQNDSIINSHNHQNTQQ